MAEARGSSARSPTACSGDNAVTARRPSSSTGCGPCSGPGGSPTTPSRRSGAAGRRPHRPQALAHRPRSARYGGRRPRSAASARSGPLARARRVRSRLDPPRSRLLRSPPPRRRCALRSLEVRATDWSRTLDAAPLAEVDPTVRAVTKPRLRWTATACSPGARSSPRTCRGLRRGLPGARRGRGGRQGAPRLLRRGRWAPRSSPRRVRGPAAFLRAASRGPLAPSGRRVVAGEARRGGSRGRGGPLVLAASDPANPYGAAIPVARGRPDQPRNLDEAGGRAQGGRTGAGTSPDARPGLSSCSSTETSSSTWSVGARRCSAGRTISRCSRRPPTPWPWRCERVRWAGSPSRKADGASVLGSDHPLVQALSQAGFHMTPRGLRLRR